MTHISRNAPQQPVVPSETHRWIVDNQDISMKFHQFRERCLQLDEYRLDEHFNELLSASGILVLQKRFDFQVLPTDLFPPDLLQAMRRDVINKHYSSDSFNPIQLLRIKEILANLIDDAINEDKARMQLLDLCETLNDYEQGVVRAIVGLIPTIYDCNMRALSEAHFSTSYIHPFMSGLFSCKRPSKVAHCSNIVADENAGINNNRPDYFVQKFEHYQYASTFCFGEIKLDTANDMSCMNDFYRLALFAKTEMDTSHLNAVICFQTIGLSTTFYIMTRKPNMLVFVELVTIVLPSNKRSIISILGYFDDLYSLATLHMSLERTRQVLLKYPTLPFDYVQSNIKTLPRKRRMSHGVIALTSKH